jgi:MSHA biogenesis protein MshM
MYESHYGLRELPFGLTPNTAFFLNTRGHREAFDLLTVAIASGEGFVKVVGEVGTGKTMLCRKLLNSLSGEQYHTAYIPNPFLNPEALFRALLEDMGETHIPQRRSFHDLQKRLNDHLIEHAKAGRQVVVVIDEAQAIPPKTLEALRLISNLETETRKLVQIVLFGQPELDRLLALNEFRQLRQRIAFSYRLPPLARDESSAYIEHRLRSAGYNGPTLFDAGAAQLLFYATQGVPRLLNVLAHKSLLSGYGKGLKKIHKPQVLAAIRDTEGVRIPSLWARWVATILLPAIIVAQLSPAFAEFAGVIA